LSFHWQVKEAGIRGASCIIVFGEESSDDNIDQSDIEHPVSKTQRAPAFQLSGSIKLYSRKTASGF
jgi:hypothetical protein